MDPVLDMDKTFTTCLKCRNGVLLPLSDYGRDGAPIMYKAWVCNNPECGFNITNRQRRDQLGEGHQHIDQIDTIDG